MSDSGSSKSSSSVSDSVDVIHADNCGCCIGGNVIAVIPVVYKDTEYAVPFNTDYTLGCQWRLAEEPAEGAVVIEIAFGAWGCTGGKCRWGMLIQEWIWNPVWGWQLISPTPPAQYTGECIDGPVDCVNLQGWEPPDYPP